MKLASGGPLRRRESEWDFWEVACEGSAVRRCQASRLCIRCQRCGQSVEQAVRLNVVLPFTCRDAHPGRILGAAMGVLRCDPTPDTSLAGVGLRALDLPRSWSQPQALRHGVASRWVNGLGPRLRWDRRTRDPIPEAVSKRACAQECSRPGDCRASSPRRKSGPCAARCCDEMHPPEESQFFAGGDRNETMPAVQLERRL
jgi:hypothetical protein